MKETIKKLIIKNLPKGVIYDLVQPYKQVNTYYSQEGEDIILERILFGKSNGFYLDVGAHHPTRFSNTYKFYLKGWHGINIDAMPGSMQLFESLRPRDINIEAGITSEQGITGFFVFKDGAMNTFDESLAIEYSKTSGKPEKVKVETFPLSTILDRYLPKSQEIDFMSIDVEGLDLKVLESNNWDKYLPKIILIECLEQEFKDISKSKVDIYLTSKGYSIFAKTFNTAFYKRKQDLT